jgi:aryl-alcohol dehydrogenase-like predicted oxidoreductase
MNSRAFGKTGWRVNEVGLGCWEFGGAIQLDGKPDGHVGVTDGESLATLRRAVELGVNFFDTADMYGWGHSEELVGRALKPHRDRLFIASKVGFWHDADGKRTYGESKDSILQACEASLRRLQTDRIDLYQCHLWRTERWPEFLEAFEALHRQGKIRGFGVSTNDFDMLQRFNERGSLASVQANYNLLDRHAERDLLPYCRQHGIAFIARGPLAMGRLSGKYSRDSRFDANDIRNKWLEGDGRQEFEQQIAIVDRLKPVAVKAGLTMVQLALGYILSRPDVSVLIPGAKNRSQLEHNVSAGALTSETLAAIEKALAG